jgi:serine-aspartate repeat-containing protein C/D/E
MAPAEPAKIRKVRVKEDEPVSLYSSVMKWGELLKSPRRRASRKPADRKRLCRFEPMEPRQLMTASPIAPQIHLGSVFFDPAPGKDTVPNTIQVTFQGGEPNTQMTQLVIDGSANQNGLAVGDIVWNTANAPVQIVSANGFQVLSTTVTNGGSQIVFNLSGFVSGDSITFTADADEVFSVNAQGVATTAPLTQGNDFQNAHLVGTFTAPHYENVTVNTAYVAGFDHLFADNNATSGSTLNLPPQDYEPPSTTDQSDQTAGANVLVTQTPLPISIAGTVYDDSNFDNLQDNGEKGVGNVTLTLMEYNGSQFVSTGVTTTTDANGNYLFQFLLPGTYEVDETVPSGYFAESAAAGTVGGTTDGSALSSTVISQIAVLGGDKSVSNNFALVEPASISGNVSDCLADTALSGVTVDLLNSSGTVVETTTTDSSGNYKFSGLQPNATYGVEQILPNGYLNHDAWAGSVGGTVAGDFDSITQVTLGDGTAATAYNFCDVLPASISGYVTDCLADQPLSNVTVELLNASGTVIQTTKTNGSGAYSFTGLMPGLDYGVEQILPTGYINHETTAGSVGGSVSNDLDSITEVPLGDGVNATAYDFCDVLPASISGSVADCLSDQPLSGVTVELLNSSGNVIQTTKTDNSGDYQFSGLLPGTSYSVEQLLPTGYLNHDAWAGSAGGTVAADDDSISQITLTDGTAATAYNFCDVLPASISGNVGDCDLGTPLSGVTVELLNSGGTVIRTTTTDESGNYQFSGLMPGQVYGVEQILPQGYLNNDAWAGSVGGTVATDFNSITQVSLGDGVAATAYNFCDVQPVGISGYVEIDTTGNPTTATNLKPLAGVTVSLLDSDGNVLQTTTTNQNGFYSFTGNLPPGTYGVSDVTPSPYFSEEADFGSVGGTVENVNLIDQVTLNSGVVGTNYNFYVDPPATISGTVFQDGPAITVPPGTTLTTAQIAQYRTGVYQPGDKLIAGVTLYLYGSDGSPIIDFSTGQQVSTTTDANGFYEFTDLPGNQAYSVVEEPLSSQPEVSGNSAQGYATVLGLTAAGTTGGAAANPGNTLDANAISALGLSPDSTAVVEIPLVIGGTSANNNFSVVVTQSPQTPPPPQIPPPPVSPPPLVPPTPLPVLFNEPVSPVSFEQPPIAPTPERFSLPAGGGEVPYDWHLSVMNDGQPRENDPPDQGLLSDAGPLVFDQSSWSSMNLGNSRWIVNDGSIKPDVNVFGTPGAIPVYGDFVGDGTTQMGVFIDGEWFIDANGDGKWDDGDLYAKLGNPGDMPVVGDWDGDGKDDIGVFGPAWPGDGRPLDREPGLPKPMNAHRGVMKNMPPLVKDAASDPRTVMRHANGKLRADVVDHVFQYGQAGDVPVVGDWTGSGVRSIGIFRDGVWYIDIHGTGKWTADDIQTQFGQPGDIPVVGDWDGSGRDSIGVYRNGTWILDTNHDFHFDAGDKVVRFGQRGDRPVVGNFTGKAKAQIGVYRNGVLERPAPVTASTATTAQK